MKANRFTAFADEDQVAHEVKQTQVQTQKAQEPKKRAVVKVQKQPEPENAHEFEPVDKQNNRGGQRGGRGGRGGDRGGRGGRGGQERGPNERGGRGGRGRGDRPRPQTAQPTTDADGNMVEQPRNERGTRDGVERRGRGGRGRGPRNEGDDKKEHGGFDKQDGTGVAQRERKDGGQQRERRQRRNDAKDGEENTNEEKPRRERREPREKKPEPVEEEKKEPEVEEEEVGFTLDDYNAAKQAKSQGLLQHKEGREREKMNEKNIKEHDFKDQKIKTQIYVKPDTNATRAGQGADLLGFQAKVDDGDVFESRGGRGGRGRQDRPRQDRPQTQRGGGRKGGKIVVDDNEFPTL